MLLRSASRFAVSRSVVRLGGAAPGQLKQFGPPTPGSPTGREGESFTGQISVMEHVKYAFLPFQNRADYGMMSWPRLDYGPHRSDYGTVSRPKNPIINIFYGVYEYPFILKEDLWAVFRFFRHVIALSFWITYFNWIYKDRPVTNL